MNDLTTTVRPKPQPTADPSPVLVPSAEGTTLVTEQQVLFSTAAATASPQVERSRWSTVSKVVSSAVSALVTASRPPAPRYQTRRNDFLEHALMSREMDRL